jgi:CRP/FNR family transcriptional regulator, cyclic AMP receptor protein
MQWSTAMDECNFAAFAHELGLYATTSLRPGDILFREGDEADALYIVSRGTLTVMSGSAVLEAVQSGGIIGEMALVDEDIPRSASVIARTHVELIRIDKSDFLALVSGAPNFAVMVMRVMARRLRIMNQRYRPQAATW